MMESKILKSHSNKYQIHVARNYDYKLVSVGDNFSKLFKSYIAEDVVYNFINSMIEESKTKKYFTRNLWWLNKMMRILKALLNVGFFIMIMLTMMLR